MSGFTRARCHRLALVFLIAASALLPATARHTHAQSSGPVASYAFSEGTGTTTADASGNGNTGTLLDAFSWGAGYFGSGVSFDGTHRGSVEIPVSASLAAMTTAFTLEAWVKPTDVSGYNPIIERNDYANLLLMLVPGGAPAIIVTLGGNSYQVAAPVGVPTNIWSHVAATYDGSALALYINGSQVASTNATGSLPSTALPFSIGRPWWGEFAGALDEVRLYARALNASEVALDRQTPADPNTPLQIGVYTPRDHALGVLTTSLTAGFTRPMDESTVTSSTFELRDSANAIVSSSVTYDVATRTATLTPTSALQPLSIYTLRVIGGGSGVKDANGVPLADEVAWSFTTATVATAPVAALAFSEGAGTTTADKSGNGNTAMLADAVAWGAGYLGSGVSFDGVHSGAVEIPMSESLAAMTTAFTLEAWVNPTDVSGYKPIIERTDYANLLLLLVPGGSPAIVVTLGDISYQVAAPVGVPTHAWSHVAATYDGGALTLYVNGISVASTNATGALPSTALPFSIGRPWWGEFAGALDEVRLYRTALTPAAIATDMTSPVDATTPLQVSTTTPADGSTGVVTTPIAAGFTAAIDIATLTSSTFALRDNTNAVMASTISYNSTTHVATLTPGSALSPSTTYAVQIAGGTSGVKSVGGAVLAADVTWSFTTASAATTPVASYAFSEGTGATTADGSGNGNTATLANAVAWGAGYVGNGVTFDGTHSGAVEIPMSDSLAAMANAFTLEAWVKPATVSGYNPVIERTDYANLLLVLVPGGNPAAVVTLGHNSYQIAAPAGLPTNTWSHVALTYDGSALRLYVNGIHVASTSASGALPSTVLPFSIGRPWWGEFAGSLDEVRLYRAALSATAIAADMTAAIDRPSTLAVVSRTPADGALGILTTPVTATFGAAVNAATVTSSTFELRDSANALVDSTVTYSPATRTATVAPVSPLTALTDYTVRIAGGNDGVQGSAGGALTGDVTWTFTTAADATAPSAAYGFYEGEGTTTLDYSGNGNTGTLVNTPTWGNGYIYFSGNDDGVSTTSSDTLAFTTGFSFEGFIELATAGRIWGQVDAAGNPVYEAGIRSDGNAYLTIHTTSGVYTVATPQAFPFAAALSATYDGSMLRLFLDATEVATLPASGSLVASTLPMQIGRGSSFYLLNVRVYRRAVTVDEMIDDVNNPVGYVPPPPPPPPLEVVSTTPNNGALGLLTPVITATFNHDVDVSTLTSATFALDTHTGTFVPSTITYEAATRTATLSPTAALLPLKRYDVIVVGGDSGVKDAAGVGMNSSHAWSFTTAADVSKPSLSYGFEDGDDVSVDDKSGNGNTGAYMNGPVYAPGYFGDALAFDGMDDELDAPLSQTLMLTNAVTFESWIYPTATGGRMWSQLDAAAPLYALTFLPTGAVQFNVVTTNGTSSVTSTSTIPLNAWTHVALSYEGASLCLYVNGTQVAVSAATGSLVTSLEPMRFGAGFTGSLDEIRVYRRALSATEIASDMSTPIHIFSPFIAAVTPGTGVVGQAIVISGGGFNAVQGSSTVTLNDSPMSVTAWNSWEITAIVPPPVPNVTGTVVRVRVGSSSGTGSFTLLQPAIGALDAATTWVGQTVSIQGNGFSVTQGPNTATLNGVPLQVSSWSSSVITFVVPPNATSGPVIVNIYGKATNAKTLTILPHINSISATSGTIGQALTLAGTTFGATQGASTITFNGTSATVTSWSNTSVTVTVPQNAGGSERITVIANGLASNAPSFWIAPVPTIIAVSPAIGQVGQAVGITGSNFGFAQGSSVITFNGVAATVVSWTDAAITATVPSGATSGAVVVTVNAQTSNAASFIVIPSTNTLAITAQVTPAPTATGWYGSTPVTATFTCTDAAFAVTSCPPRAFAWTEGTNMVLGGAAMDAGGNQASLSVAVNVDIEPPQLSVLTPAASTLFPRGTAFVTITGSAVDGLSGIDTITCGSVSATLMGSRYSCGVTVVDGMNTVHVTATDKAGHSVSKDASIRVGDVAASALSISPAKFTLMVGSRQQLSITDDLGRTVTGGAWQVSDDAVAQLVFNNDVEEVHALAPGTATLTFTKGVLTATSVVTVVASNALQPGTTLWELPPSQLGAYPGAPSVPFQRGEVLRAFSTPTADSNTPGLYFIEHSLYDTVFTSGDTNALANTWPTRIRAATADGREVWQYSPPTPARQVAADNLGGLILNLGRLENYGYNSSKEHSIQRLDSHGNVRWDYWPADPSSTISEIAIHPNGTVFFVENTPSHSTRPDQHLIDAMSNAHAQLVALDADSGALSGVWPLFNTASGPLVQEDGSVIIGTFRQGSAPTDTSFSLATFAPDHPALGVAFAPVTLDNLSEDYFLTANQPAIRINLKNTLWQGTDRYHLVPDGHGGLLLPVGVGDLGGSAYRRTLIYHIDQASSAVPAFTGTFQIDQGEAQLVVGEDAAWALVQEPYKSYLGTPAVAVAFDPVALTYLQGDELYTDTANELPTTTVNGPVPNYYSGPNLTLRYAKAGGGVVISGPRDGNGAPVVSGIDGGWPAASVAPSTQIGLAAAEVPAAGTASYSRGAGNNLVAADQTKGIFVKGHVIASDLIPATLEYHHASVRIVPTHQALWLADPSWGNLFTRDSTTGPYYVTIGAASNALPSLDGLCTFGVLTMGFNRGTDRTRPVAEMEKLSVASEDTVIRQLLETSAHYRNDVDYNCFPLGNDNTYNSNGFVSGLLKATHAPFPLFPTLELNFFPGWIKPVPLEHYRQ